MFMFNEKKDHGFDASKMLNGWRAKRVFSANDVATIVSEFPASPCVWAKGGRNGLNWRMAEWVGLDFDQDITEEEVLQLFSEHIHVIGHSKSHGTVKDGIVQNRFRVFLKLVDRCTNAEDYKLTVKKLIKQYGADRNCSDTARFFWPCKKIISCRYYGRLVNVEDSKKIVERNKEIQRKKRESFDRRYCEHKIIPQKIRYKLEYGVPEGCKNNHCYGIAIDLAYIGYSEDEIFDLIMGSAIPIDQSQRVQDEVRAAIRNGIKKAR